MIIELTNNFECWNKASLRGSQKQSERRVQFTIRPTLFGATV